MFVRCLECNKYRPKSHQDWPDGSSHHYYIYKRPQESFYPPQDPTLHYQLQQHQQQFYNVPVLDFPHPYQSNNRYDIQQKRQHAKQDNYRYEEVIVPGQSRENNERNDHRRTGKEKCHSNLEEETSHSSSDEDELELTPEIIAFLKGSRERRLKREKAQELEHKKARQIERDSFVTREEIEESHQEKLTALYSEKEVENICSLEAQLNKDFDFYCDNYSPIFWPSLPIRL